MAGIAAVAVTSGRAAGCAATSSQHLEERDAPSPPHPDAGAKTPSHPGPPVRSFGNRTFHGSTGDLALNAPIVGGATDVSTYDGYWIVASDGGVFTFNAPFHRSLADRRLSSPAVEIEPTPTGNGYGIVQADGTVTPFGGAEFHGGMRGTGLDKPRARPDGVSSRGSWPPPSSSGAASGAGTRPRSRASGSG